MYNRAPLQEDEKSFFECDSLELPCRYSKGGCLVYHNRSKIERLYDLLIIHFYNDKDLAEHGIKRMPQA